MILNHTRILGENLRKLRLQRGISIEQLAEYMDVDMNEITDMEDGKSDCSIRILFDYTHALSLNAYLIQKKYLSTYKLFNHFVQFRYRRKKKTERKYLPVEHSSHIDYYDREEINESVKYIQNNIFEYIHENLTIQDIEEKTGMNIKEVNEMGSSGIFMTLTQICRICNAIKAKIIIVPSDYYITPSSVKHFHSFVRDISIIVLFYTFILLIQQISIYDIRNFFFNLNLLYKCFISIFAPDV